MIASLTNRDWAIIAGGAMMAAGTLLPIFKIPVVGTINYIGDGRGDGVIVLVLSAAIVSCAVLGYRRIAGIIGVAAALLMLTTIIRLAEALANARGEATKLAADNPFGALAVAVTKAVGFEWGWILLLGGAILAIAAGLTAPRETPQSDPTASGQASDYDRSDNAEQVVARYIEKHGWPSASPHSTRSSATTSPTFGKRRAS